MVTAMAAAISQSEKLAASAHSGEDHAATEADHQGGHRDAAGEHGRGGGKDEEDQEDDQRGQSDREPDHDLANRRRAVFGIAGRLLRHLPGFHHLCAGQLGGGFRIGDRFRLRVRRWFRVRVGERFGARPGAGRVPGESPGCEQPDGSNHRHGPEEDPEEGARPEAEQPAGEVAGAGGHDADDPDKYGEADHHVASFRFDRRQRLVRVALDRHRGQKEDIGDQPEAAEHEAGDEGDPHEDCVNLQVAGETGRDAADVAVGTGAG